MSSGTTCEACGKEMLKTHYDVYWLGDYEYSTHFYKCKTCPTEATETFKTYVPLERDNV